MAHQNQHQIAYGLAGAAGFFVLLSLFTDWVSIGSFSIGIGPIGLRAYVGVVLVALGALSIAPMFGAPRSTTAIVGVAAGSAAALLSIHTLFVHIGTEFAALGPWLAVLSALCVVGGSVVLRAASMPSVSTPPPAVIHSEGGSLLKTCPACAEDVQSKAQICKHCGYNFGSGSIAQPRRTNGLAVASLVLGLLWLYGLGSLLAVIFGHVSISQTNRDPSQGGNGLAVAGLVLGYIGLAGLLALMVAAASLT